MSNEQKNYLKNNLISISTLVVLIGFVIQQSKWQQDVDNRLKALEVHTVDTELHLPFSKRIEVFVPRVEIDSRLSNIELSLTEIKSDLKKMSNP